MSQLNSNYIYQSEILLNQSIFVGLSSSIEKIEDFFKSLQDEGIDIDHPDEELLEPLFKLLGSRHARTILFGLRWINKDIPNFPFSSGEALLEKARSASEFNLLEIILLIDGADITALNPVNVIDSMLLLKGFVEDSEQSSGCESNEQDEEEMYFELKTDCLKKIYFNIGYAETLLKAFNGVTEDA